MYILGIRSIYSWSNRNRTCVFKIQANCNKKWENKSKNSKETAMLFYHLLLLGKHLLLFTTERGKNNALKKGASKSFALLLHLEKWPKKVWKKAKTARNGRFRSSMFSESYKWTRPSKYRVGSEKIIRQMLLDNFALSYYLQQKQVFWFAINNNLDRIRN